VDIEKKRGFFHPDSSFLMHSSNAFPPIVPPTKVLEEDGFLGRDAGLLRPL
jgi:hypothetical protein